MTYVQTAEGLKRYLNKYDEDLTAVCITTDSGSSDLADWVHVTTPGGFWHKILEFSGYEEIYIGGDLMASYDNTIPTGNTRFYRDIPIEELHAKAKSIINR